MLHPILRKKNEAMGAGSEFAILFKTVHVSGTKNIFGRVKRQTSMLVAPNIPSIPRRMGADMAYLVNTQFKIIVLLPKAKDNISGP